MRGKWLGVLIPVVIVVLWEALWHIDDLRMVSLSRPWDVAIALFHGLAGGAILIATIETFEAALLGFLIAAVIGLFVGLILGLLPSLESIVGPSIDAMRPVPSVALIPLSLMIFGFGVRMEAAVVAFACLWPILIVTIAAVRGVDTSLLNVARVLEMTAYQRLVKIILPAALARVAVGLQLALAISLIVAVTVEIVLNPRGLGHGMMSAQQAMRFDQMYAQLLWIGIVGWGLSAGSQALLNRWSPAYRADRAKERA
ncbi:ABC transporter permease [Pusillimonas sp.]|uniref:ABC transporter permease n=1 Tax=Pusillimonas sp. TaxID=3040095 RepID=UPI0037C8E3A1